MLNQLAKSALRKIPYFRKIYDVYILCGYAPGHYYSPIPDLEEVKKNEKRIFENENIRGIDLRAEKQFELLKELKQYYGSIPFSIDGSVKDSLRYSAIGAFYRFSDAILLYSMMRHFKPKRIIEIGSGHSSALMLDTNELFFNNSINLTFIEPYPEDRLNAVLRGTDRQNSKVMKAFVQDVDPSVFSVLDENDILFVDSSHVSKTGSDVNHIVFDIFPTLKPGVLIHVHDIYYPFELPRKWTIENKWYWNESYLLRAFLMNNPDYEIVMFNSYMHKKKYSWFEENMPGCLLGSEETGCLWIRKIK